MARKILALTAALTLSACTTTKVWEVKYSEGYVAVGYQLGNNATAQQDYQEGIRAILKQRCPFGFTGKPVSDELQSKDTVQTMVLPTSQTTSTNGSMTGQTSGGIYRNNSMSPSYNYNSTTDVTYNESSTTYGTQNYTYTATAYWRVQLHKCADDPVTQNSAFADKCDKNTSDIDSCYVKWNAVARHEAALYKIAPNENPKIRREYKALCDKGHGHSCAWLENDPQKRFVLFKQLCDEKSYIRSCMNVATEYLERGDRESAKKYARIVCVEESTLLPDERVVACELAKS